MRGLILAAVLGVTLVACARTNDPTKEAFVKHLAQRVCEDTLNKAKSPRDSMVAVGLIVDTPQNYGRIDCVTALVHRESPLQK